MDNTIVQHINTMSYNSTGWGTFKADFLNTLLTTHSVHVCAIQEHMLLSNNLYKIEQCFPSYDVFSILAVHSGRLSGGLSLLFSKKLSVFTSRIALPDCSRVHGLKLNLPSANFVFINAYFPTDTHENNAWKLF